jgi:CubicO group peptidase (beta-lactamase class C family)
MTTRPLIVFALLSLGLVAASPAATATRHNAPRAEKFAATLPALLQKHNVPSVALALVRNGQVVVVSSSGEQSPGVAVSNETLYNVASLTKPITAQTLLRLHSQGVLSLDDPMHEHWIDPDIKTDPRHALLTARLALSHQTGFANWRRQTGGTLRFKFAPGKGYGYSGEGFEYVARWLSAKTKLRLDAHAEAQVFMPLGMKSTAYTRQPWFDGRIAQPSKDGVYHSPDIADTPVASDELYTTAADYAKFLVGVIDAVGLDDKTAAMQRTIHVDQTQELCNRKQPHTCPKKAGMGIGWQVLEFEGKTFLMHTGNDRGEFTFAYWSPTTREGAVILTNSSAGAKVVIDLIDFLRFDDTFATYLKALATK